MTDKANHGRPLDPPVDDAYVEHLRWQADRDSDGVWVNPAVLDCLIAVFEAASKVRDLDAVAVELGVGIAVDDRGVYNAVADMYDAVDRARGSAQGGA